jgi:hypothetical protein
VVDAIANWPLTHMKNPIIYNQTPKFKDLTFKIPISVLYKKSRFQFFKISSSSSTSSLQHHHHPPPAHPGPTHQLVSWK